MSSGVQRKKSTTKKCCESNILTKHLYFLLSSISFVRQKPPQFDAKSLRNIPIRKQHDYKTFSPPPLLKKACFRCMCWLSNTKIKDRCASAFFLLGAHSWMWQANTWQGPNSQTLHAAEIKFHTRRGEGVFIAGFDSGGMGTITRHFSGFCCFWIFLLLPYQSLSAGRQRLHSGGVQEVGIRRGGGGGKSWTVV